MRAIKQLTQESLSSSAQYIIPFDSIMARLEACRTRVLKEIKKLGLTKYLYLVNATDNIDKHKDHRPPLRVPRIMYSENLSLC